MVHQSSTMAGVPHPASRMQAYLRAWAQSLMGAFAIAAASQISVHFLHTNVPFTLQPQAVLLTGAFLGPRRGFAAVCQYLIAGALGAPVFAGGAGGAMHLIGPTSGFLLSYLIAAPTVGLFAKKRPLWVAGGFGLATALTLFLGACGLSVYFGPVHAWALGITPFWRVDAAKAALSFCVYRAVARVRT